MCPLPEKLHAVCPYCSRKLSKMPATSVATMIHRRKCPGCHRDFVIKVTPKQILEGNGWLHILELTVRQRDVTVLQ